MSAPYEESWEILPIPIAAYGREKTVPFGEDFLGESWVKLAENLGKFWQRLA